MEDSHNQTPINLEGQLRNLTELQARIQQARKSLNQLNKLQSNENKNLQTIYRWSDATTRNKLNLVENHQLINRKREQENQQVTRKHQRVKQMREKEEKQLREIKSLLKLNKENQRSIIRNNSLLHDEAIKQNRKLELEKKQKLVNEIKKQKQNYKVGLADSRLEEKKKKQAEIFNKTFAKMQKLPVLIRELEKISKEKQEIEKRLEERRQHKEKIKQDVIRIQKMKENQLLVSLNLSNTQARKKLIIQKNLGTPYTSILQKGHPTILSPISNTENRDLQTKLQT